MTRIRRKKKERKTSKTARHADVQKQHQIAAKQPVIRLMRPWHHVESVDSEKLRRRDYESGARYRERKEKGGGSESRLRQRYGRAWEKDSFYYID
jgi:hypothetical protein